MASKGKSKRETIKLVSTEGSGAEKAYPYFTQKNKANTPDKLRIKKYNKKLRRHVEYKEEKV